MEREKSEGIQEKKLCLLLVQMEIPKKQRFGLRSVFLCFFIDFIVFLVAS